MTVAKKAGRVDPRGGHVLDLVHISGYKRLILFASQEDDNPPPRWGAELAPGHAGEFTWPRDDRNEEEGCDENDTDGITTLSRQGKGAEQECAAGIP